MSSGIRSESGAGRRKVSTAIAKVGFTTGEVSTVCLPRELAVFLSSGEVEDSWPPSRLRRRNYCCNAAPLTQCGWCDAGPNLFECLHRTALGRG